MKGKARGSLGPAPDRRNIVQKQKLEDRSFSFPLLFSRFSLWDNCYILAFRLVHGACLGRRVRCRSCVAFPRDSFAKSHYSLLVQSSYKAGHSPGSIRRLLRVVLIDYLAPPGMPEDDAASACRSDAPRSAPESLHEASQVNTTTDGDLQYGRTGSLKPNWPSWACSRLLVLLGISAHFRL